jgi:hypothetical protein
MPTASEKFGYHNRFFNGLRETDRQQVEAALEALREADIGIGVSSGRAERALNTSFAEHGRNSNEKKYSNYNDIGFRGDTFDLAAPKYEKDYKKLVAIFASSSGETEETLEPLEQLTSYLQQSGSDKWNILLLTQNPNSRIGKIAKENNGIVVELKGSENLDSKNYREFGMQRDVGEHQILWFSQAACQTLMEGKGVDRFFEFVDERIPEVCRKIDEWSESETCKDIIYNLRRHCHAFAAGRKGGKEVARFFIKRMGQVKQLAEDQAYLFGENAPDPRVGDLVFPISKSGGREDFYSEVLKGKKSSMVVCCEKSQKAGAIVYPFVGTPDSPMEKVCGIKNTVLVDSISKGFSDAYARIMTQQGIIPIMLAEVYDKEDGIDISPKNLKKKHGF